MPDQTYFHIKNRGGVLEAKGNPAYSLGHRIDRGPAARPDGVFFEWSWNGRRLTVRNDRYGIYPLYYCHHEGDLYLSPSIREILTLGAPNGLDYDALSVFIRLGFFVGEDTPFKHIKVLPPDATFLYENGALTVSGKYATREPLRISEDDAIDEYIRLFRQAMKRRLPAPGEKFMMPLSGGRDSRHILLELCHLGYKPDCVVTLRPYPPYFDEDIRIAKLVCEAVGVKHRTLEHKRSWFTDEQRALEITNYCSDEHAWFLELADYFKDKTKVSYDGIAGDVFPVTRFWSPDLSSLYDKKSYVEICRILFKTWSWMRPDDDVLSWGLEKNFLKRISEERAIARITEELKKHSSANNPTTSFYFSNRCRRTVAAMSYAVNAGVPTIYSPFLDHDLYDFLATLPEKLYYDRNLHDKTIARAYPQYADIPYEFNDAKRVSDSDHKDQYTREFARYMLKGSLGSSRILKKGYLMPRMVKALWNKRYRSSLWRIAPPALTYLSRLEKLQNVKGKMP